MSKNTNNAEEKGFWHHPMTILIAGTVFTAVLIPVITHIITDHIQAVEARVKQQAAVYRLANEMNMHLNNMTTEIEEFENSYCTAEMSGDDLRKAQEQFRIRMLDHRQHLGAASWWALGQLRTEIHLGKFLTPDNEKKMGALIDGLGNNLTSSLNHIGSLKLSYLRQNKPPLAYNPISRIITGEKTDYLIRVKQSELLGERSVLFTQLAELLNSR